MRRITLAACTLAVATAASREVHKLRAAQSACSGPGYQDERNRSMGAPLRVGGCPAKETKECHVGYKWMVDTADMVRRPATF